MRAVHGGSLLGWMVVWVAAVAGWTASAAPPNVVVILADDLGFSDPGCYGGEIDTPHLDALAAGGLRFTQGYNTARCWPSRGALLTGYYAQSIRRDALAGAKGGQGTRPAWARLLPELLAAAGYRSYHSGKWHVDGAPLRSGFARSLQIEGGQNDYFDPAGVTVDGQPIASTKDFYITTAVGDHAVACLEDHAASHAGRPFFQYVAFTAPHFPLQAPQDLVAKYRERYRAGWNVVQAARVTRLRELGIVTTTPAAMEPDVGPPYPFPGAVQKLGMGEVNRPLPWDSLTDEQREFQATKMAIHAAMVDAMDQAIGRIVAQLKAMQAFENTLILFASDNGGSAEIMVRGKGHDQALPPGASGTYLCLGPGWSSCANTPFRRHKTWVHEGGIATPWIVHWPAGIVGKGQLRTQPVHLVDVAPTVLDVAGVTPPREHAGTPVPPMQGRRFTAALADAAAPPAHETLWWLHEGNRAVRVGDWKLVATKGGPWELYDLSKDRCETTNLAGSAPEKVAALSAAWERMTTECRTLAELDGERPATEGNDVGKPPRRPNVIYVMTDDQGYGDIAAHGNPVIRTPHLDRMRAESVRFPEFHASPTCSPTRSALLTGRHEFRSGVTHTIFERERLALSATTLPQLLTSAGYTSGIFGKWHLGDEDEYQPAKRGFDRVFIHGAGGIGQTFPGSCGDVPGNSYFDPVIRSDGTFVKTKGYCTDVFFDAALAWIDQRRMQDAPFFCLITPNAPHGPLDCPVGSDEPYLAKLEAAGVVNPKQRRDIAKVYGMIENVDTNMGKLLRQLDAWGLAEDTLVVFTTDNGTATGAPVFNDGMRGHKGTPYRGGTRVPSFWRWKGRLRAGIDAPAHHVAHLDVLPTLCEFAGVTMPPAVAATVEGRSLVPLLEGRETPWPDRPLVTHVGRWERGKAADAAYRNCRIREGRWSLVNTRNRPDAWELYDVVADPGEAKDVAADQPEIVKRLAATYDEWWKSVQPDLVNEDLDGPPQNPFKVAYRKQFGSTDASQRRPNIVFFLCDDLGTGDVSALGSKDIRTPNIDRLFARGTRLSRHWAGCAVCAPSRCVLMTGKHPGHAVVRSNREVKPEGQAPMPAGTVTLAGLLHEAGYATGGFGKWGLGAPGSASDPLACGFDRFFGYNCQRQAHSFYPDHLWDGRERIELDGKTYSADLIAERQLEFVRANAARPFFLYVPTTVPHLALQVPDDEPSLAGYRRHFQGEEPYTGGRGYTPTEHPLATYAAMITRMDREVGRLVSLLDELDLADDTIFVFSSDNGGTFPGIGGLDTVRLKSNGELRDWKGSPYEGGLRVPTVAVWPGRIAAARTVDAPTGFEDWLPTLLELAGLEAKVPAGLDGVSLAGMLLGEEPPQAGRMLYRELTEGRWQAAVEGTWKVVRKAAKRAAQKGGGRQPANVPQPTELYDLAMDPTESRNVAAERPEVLARMEAILDREHVPDPSWPLPFADAKAVATTTSNPTRDTGATPSAPAVSSASAPNGRRPNILFILVDDQSPFDFRFYDPRSTLQAPVLERLAAQGMVLDAAYHMGSFSGAVCVPSRHMLMCGRSVWHLPIGPGRRCPPDILDQTMAAVFNRAGFSTMRTCKKENCYPAADELFTVRHVATKRGDTPETGSPWHAEQVLSYLDARASSGERSPFLITLGFSHPHDTRDGMADLLAKYGARNHTDRSAPPPLDPRQPPLPANWLPRHPFDNTALEIRDERQVSGVWDRRDEATIRNELGREFACAELIDTQIGRVLEKLAALGELDNTWIVYTSDHGIAIGRHGLQGKQNLYEHTWRVPMIVKGPGVKPGSRAPGNVYLLDLLATFCDIAGIDAPPTNEGRSFKTVLEGRAPAVRDVLYGVYSGNAKPGIRAVRDGDWKLIVYEDAAGGVRESQLFNLRDNPDELLAEHQDPAVTAISKRSAAPEQRNLAADPAHAAKLGEMQSRLLTEMERHDDPYRFWNQPAGRGEKP